MASIQKYKKTSLGVITRHFERARRPDGEYYNWGNQEIDKTKSYLNYNLHENQNQLEFIKKRTSEVRCLNRANVNLMCAWVITAPKELKENELEKFFKSSYDFFNKKYGEENCISAYVHMDETTPHMHYAFVPVVKDKKREGYKVSADELITRRHLQTFHSELDEYMKNSFGRDIGVYTEITKEFGNKKVAELKRETIKKDLEDKKKILTEVSNLAQEAKKKVDEYKTTIDQLETEYRAKKGYMKDIKNENEIGNLIPSYAKVSKKVISREEYISLPKEKWVSCSKTIREESKRVENMQKALEKQIQAFQNTISGQNITIMQNEIKTLKENAEKEKKRLIGQYNSLVKKYNNMIDSKNTKLESQSKKYENDLKAKDEKYKSLDRYVDDVIERLSENSKKEFLDKWNNLEKYKEQERQQEIEKRKQHRNQSRGMSL